MTDRQSQGKERKSVLRLPNEIVSDGNAELCEDALALAGETDALMQTTFASATI